ncbi:MAG TPA: MBL fold metallo-hydrolase, partial [Quisquiliibacterium sp.]|nr:MBL fold metallo-hydrolase [Quisquiliibacterium sp.]
APGASGAGQSQPGMSAAQDGPYPPLSVTVRPKRLGERAWFVQGDAGPVSRENEGFNSNAGFVVTDEGVVVFDALGSPALGAELLAQIRRITPLPVRRVIVSHYHADHVYGLQPFRDAGAEIWAHRKVREYLATEAPAARLEERRQSLAPWVDARTSVVPPDRYLDGDTGFRLGGLGFRVLAVAPAHTAEDLMLLVEEEGVLFAGDLMFAGRVPFVGDADSRSWLDSVRRLVEMKPRVLVGGHGPASTDAARDLALTRDYLAYLRDSMGRAVEQMLGFDEAYAATDWSRYRDLPAFEAANRRNAYNTYLRMEQEALGGAK